MKEYLESKLEPRKNVFKKAPEKLAVFLADFCLIRDSKEVQKDDLNFQIKCKGINEFGPVEKILTSFIISNKDNILDLGELLKKYEVRMTQSGKNEQSGGDINGKMAIHMGHTLTPKFVLALLHEFGHLDYTDFLKETDPGKLRKLLEADNALINQDGIVQNIDDKEKAKEFCQLKLEDERVAWSFALKKLRPFIKEDGLFSKDDVLNLIHDIYLQNYSRIVGAKINSGIIKFFDKFLASLTYMKAKKIEHLEKYGK